MNEEEAFKHREYWLEEEYFRKKEEELIERLRRQKLREQELQAMGRELQITDPLILQALVEGGYTPDMAKLIYFAPLVQVAWADGSVSAHERDLIIARARAAGIAEESHGDQQLKTWLSERPSEDLFKVNLIALQAALSSLPAEEADSLRQRLLDACAAVAEASRGALGLGARVSRAEHEALDQIAAALSPELEGRQ